MDYAHVEEGETFLMGKGERGELDYASGLYRATADLDLKLLYDEFMAQGKVNSSADEVTLLFGDEDDYRKNRMERYFQEWLLDKGHVERVPCKVLTLCSEIQKKPDGSGTEGVMYSSLDDPLAGVADELGPFPRYMA